MKPAVKVGDLIRVLVDNADCSGVSAQEVGVVRYTNSEYVDAHFLRGTWSISHENYEIVREERVVETPTETPDAVFRPAHYARFPIEPITFITANKLGFLVGNVIKYVLRHDAKNGLEDLRKARRYLDIMIEDAERTARGESLKVETV